MEFARNLTTPSWRCAAANSELITIALAFYNCLVCIKFDPLIHSVVKSHCFHPFKQERFATFS